MKIEDAYRSAIVAGGNAINFAMGLIEGALRRDPEDYMALMYKGGLLTIIGDVAMEAPKKATYQQTGVSLMQRALDASPADSRIQAKLQYVYATTLAMLPQAFEFDQTAYDTLHKLVARPSFATFEKLEFVRSTTLLACLAEQFGYVAEAKTQFSAARRVDQDLAIETYDVWLNRG